MFSIWPNILAWIAGAEASLVMVPQIRLMHKLKSSRGLSHGVLAIRQFSFSCLVLYVLIVHEWTLAISYSFSLFVNAYAWYVKFKYSG
ncbi:MAG: hypothetical protein CMF39_03240 [Legionellaceae bacterium]|nr:hypothetical protein [Legionellaceae bacterium]|tara:strand:- start:12 stop:275 length:264 start_codon:yes stop_codon:yes gene_type:complete